jgi:hypothetical protein
MIQILDPGAADRRPDAPDCFLALGVTGHSLKERIPRPDPTSIQHEFFADEFVISIFVQFESNCTILLSKSHITQLFNTLLPEKKPALPHTTHFVYSIVKASRPTSD